MTALGIGAHVTGRVVLATATSLRARPTCWLARDAGLLDLAWMNRSRRYSVATSLHNCRRCGRRLLIGRACRSTVHSSSSQVLKRSWIVGVRCNVWIIYDESVYVIVRDDVCHNFLVLLLARHLPATL